MIMIYREKTRVLSWLEMEPGKNI